MALTSLSRSLLQSEGKSLIRLLIPPTLSPLPFPIAKTLQASPSQELGARNGKSICSAEFRSLVVDCLPIGLLVYQSRASGMSQYLRHKEYIRHPPRNCGV